MLNNAALDKDQRAGLISRYSKTIIQYKFDLIALNLDTLENIRRGHEQSISDLEEKLGQVCPPLLRQAIADRQQTMIKRHQKLLEHKLNSSNSVIYTQTTASLPFIEVDLNLSAQQMSMLINGLKYVVPCQTKFSVAATSGPSINTIVNQQFESIFTIMAVPELRQIIDAFKSQKISKQLEKRARHEYKTVQSIRRLLRERPDIVICRTDKTKALYIGNRTTMARKAYEYMDKTTAYEETVDGRSPLSDILQGLQTLLDYVVRTHGLTDEQRKKLLPNLNRLELAHYHGLPKTHKDGIPLRPIIASIYSPLTLLSKFLNNLLAPIYLQVARETTFINDIDLVRKLESHVDKGFFNSTTIFVTADVKDLYTMIPRQSATLALMRFLEKYAKHGKIGTLAIEHILRMARFILDSNYFVYNNKYYRQIRSGAMGSAFTQVLANIYMFEWEQELIAYIHQHNGIYGRYIDDIFIVTNQSLAEVQLELQKAQTKDINIEITPVIGTSVNFLDVIVINENGHLRTSIYHKPTAQPYFLPYTSDHRRHIHRNIPYTALLRAARLCSHAKDFDIERIRIDMSLLLNHYPPRFISYHFNKFFENNNAAPVLQRLDKNIYRHLHHNLLHKCTRHEKQLNMMTKNPVPFPTVLQNKPWDKCIMYLRYKYDSGLTTHFPKQFHKWWNKHCKYAANDLNNVSIRMIGNSNRTLKQWFIHKKPSEELLTRLDPKLN
ncbi:unnamed protein product [Adineta ricciae]|uniref:Reverse transcriptase domain-containing protein n=1 Tax=Adineta ricciae TaxID=249248 RepID=A0A815LYL9_ADIRI|nr:unnamed protein product [Adineta ricciae]CAF1524598.1 unnamed protein product [Adineta ricciae]